MAANPQILIVDDDAHIRDVVSYALVKANFRVAEAIDGNAALEAVAQTTFDLIVLDILMPEKDGIEVCNEIRRTSQVPILFLSSKNEEIDRIVGLELGADDYVCKPFIPREVVTRVKVILKRVEKSPNAKPISNENTFQHKAEHRSIYFNDQALDLTRAEYELMVTFLSQPGRVFSRRQLIESVWSSNHPSDDRAVDTHIKTLRAKLKPYNPHKDFITTHRGFGYSLEL